jgi:DNA-binding PadR family transcriptional regulator
MTATPWEHPFDDKIRRLVALRAMAGRGRHRFGPGPGGPPGGFGRGPWMWQFLGGPPGPGGFGRRAKARRGDVRTAALLLLAEEPRNGYQIMQELEERSEGMWRPSPGSVYPALQQLEDEGLIRSDEQDGRRLYHLTDAGRAFVDERPDDEPAPWETFANTFTDDHAEFGALMRDLAMAFVQVQHSGTEAQVAEARRVLADARRSLYRILADGEPAGEDAE